MKKAVTYISLSAIFIFGLVFLINIIEYDQKFSGKDPYDDFLPLNLSIYLDLSDRLTRNLTTSQAEQDMGIINYAVDSFFDYCIESGIPCNVNRFQVILYPKPNCQNIVQFADSLSIDLSKIPKKQKVTELMNMKTRFQNNLAELYSDATSDCKSIESDICGFFSNREVDKLCVRNGYRNALIILTDGFLSNNIIEQVNAYSYILPHTLPDPNTSLMTIRKGLSDLKVLMMEINLYDFKQRDQLITTLGNWFMEMEIRRFDIFDNTMPNMSKRYYIDQFIFEPFYEYLESLYLY
ncbi:MAG: hypothetical protein HDS01_09180 [Bacteroides sp.]|nr:hypothetical protein [Bacteroides sp.]